MPTARSRLLCMPAASTLKNLPQQSPPAPLVAGIGYASLIERNAFVAARSDRCRC